MPYWNQGDFVIGWQFQKMAKGEEQKIWKFHGWEA